MKNAGIDPLVISVFVGVGLYLLVVAILPKDFLFKTQYTKKHLKTLEQNQYIDEVESNLVRDTYQSTGLFARAFYALPFSNYFHLHIVRAGMAAKVDSLFLACLAVFVGVLLSLSYMKIANFLEILLLSIAAGYFLGYTIISGKIKKRTVKFVAQFPDALDTIVRSVRSGFPVNAAVNMVHESMDAPIAEEFKLVSDEVHHGSTLVDALGRLSERMQLADVKFFAVVLTLQQEVGGNLAEPLENLSDLIRKRRMMKLKIHALASEGRSTGWVLGLLPVFVAGGIQFMSPDFLAPLWYTSSGHWVVGSAITSIAIGVGIVRKMSNMEI